MKKWIGIAFFVAVIFFALTVKAPETFARNGIDSERALSERSLGNADAPVIIQEFASLSCGHCAHFHKEILPDLQEKYIDTGKVRFIFTDFPLNASALDAAMISRCLPESRYFRFIKFLFETQESWAFSKDYKNKLKQNAKLLGLSGDAFDACLENRDLRMGLVQRMQQAQKTHDINSTPSFVINGTEIIKGARSISDFDKILDKILQEGDVH